MGAGLSLERSQRLASNLSLVRLWSSSIGNVAILEHTSLCFYDVHPREVDARAGASLPFASFLNEILA